ncbi:ABC transporter permease [Rubinisphaera sp. JC750]|uniref:ABC transporter permease n=1 Tax=Rubinisphaera sp. JC750 TaxID=2898658 RepID=UPI001F2A6AD2|nr:hypothetical protein [Rubinisphaera sp. JC750]
MSTLDITANRMETFSDWMNPILVKETRQALKSRQFAGTFLLLLVACWLICVFGVAASGGNLEFGQPSRNFLQSFYFVLAAAVVIIIPYTAYRSLLTEQDAQTFELLSITSLTARQIVWGKLLNSIVQISVLYCAIAPFVAFTSLLQGFDLMRTLIVLTSLFGVASLLSMFTLMLSTVSRGRQIQTLASLFIFGGLISMFSTSIGMGMALINGEFSLDIEFYLVWAACWVIGLSYFALFMQITVSQLTFDSANKSTGVRLVATAQFLLFWAILPIGSWLFGTTISEETIYAMIFVSLAHWAIFGFFISMERNYLSRRVRRDIPKNILVRLLAVPFMPGGTRGYLLLLLNLGLLTGLFSAFRPAYTGYGADPYFVYMGVTAYILFYYGLGCFISRVMLRSSSAMQPMHARTVLIVIVAMGVIVPYFILWGTGIYDFDGYNNVYHPLLLSNPFATLGELSDLRSSETGLVRALWIGACMAIVLNLRAMAAAVQEILAPKRPKSHAETSDPAAVAAAS